MMQLITPNPNIPCKPGWCLAYVNEAFGVPKVFGTATAAWLGSTTKHRDYMFPSGVWFPVWFSLAGEPAGHVALVAPNGNVYSTSDLSTVPRRHPDLADLIRYYAHYGMTLTYLGWTEDVEGTPVIDPAGSLSYAGESITPTQEDDLMATPEQRQELIKDLLDHAIDESRPGKAITLRQMLSEYRDHVVQTQEKISNVPENVLNARIPRGGGLGGETSLGAVTSWHDPHVVQIIAAVASLASNDGASIEEIKAAVRSAIEESVIKVDVTVEGAQS